MIAHLVKKAWFERFAGVDFYESETLGEEGFIHCCAVDDVDEIRNRYFIGASEILMLLLNPDLIAASIKYEPGFGGKLFPHIYGPLNKSAIVAVEKLDF